MSVSLSVATVLLKTVVTYVSRWKNLCICELMINIIAKQCSRIFSTTYAYLHHHLWTEILDFEGFGLQNID